MQLLLRPAQTGDADEIARLMRNGVSDQVRRMTIMRSPKLGKFVAGLVEEGREVFIVASISHRLVGVSAWRQESTTLHLNHLYVSEDQRGVGIGTAFVLDGLRRLPRGGADTLQVDVFAENVSALQWYRSWGMREESRSDWFTLTLPPARLRQDEVCRVDGWTEAELKHACYGFSQFTLRSRGASYPIDRLGARYYRVRDCEILNDGAALSTLKYLDPRRHLLCIGTLKDVPEKLQSATSPAAQSARLVCRCQTILTHLTAAVNRRRSSICSVSIQ